MKNDIGESAHKTLILLDLGSNDRNYTNVLRPRRFKLCDFSTNCIWYCSIYARHFLPVKFFLQYYFDKLVYLNYCSIYARHLLPVKFFPSITLINYASSYRKM